MRCFFCIVFHLFRSNSKNAFCLWIISYSRLDSHIPFETVFFPFFRPLLSLPHLLLAVSLHGSFYMYVYKYDTTSVFELLFHANIISCDRSKRVLCTHGYSNITKTLVARIQLISLITVKAANNVRYVYNRKVSVNLKSVFFFMMLAHTQQLYYAFEENMWWNANQFWAQIDDTNKVCPVVWILCNRKRMVERKGEKIKMENGQFIVKVT